MELILGWLLPVWLVVVAGAVGVTLAVRRRRSAPEREGRAVANSSRLTSLPGFAAAMRRYRALLAAVLAASAVLLLASAGLTARPAAEDVVYPEARTRDIMLCLDVSGSMIEYDAELVDVFAELATEFDGERIGLVVFNASAVTYFPLTSDYDYIREQFDAISDQFDDETGEYFAGTFFGEGSSLVGDGLASCAQRFDGGTGSGDEERSRSIVLATDNLVVGEPIFTLAEAAALASDSGIRVYGLNPGDQESREYLDEFATQFEDAMLATGGDYYALGDPAAVGSIVDRIGAEEAVASRGAPQLVVVDRPAVLAVLALLAVTALMVLAWRADA